ncbi:MAG: hypothetical protein IT428_05945 [Planctomycetaceae bacterium]|nr:hypothetical protein [Planctomycetaceae bacterium]
MRCAIGLAVVGMAAFVSTTKADVVSGPTIGGDVPALKAHATTGASAGKEVDFAADRGKKPTIYILIQGEHWSRPMARFLKSLEGTVKKANSETTIVVVWLTDDVGGLKTQLPRVQESLKFESTTLAVYEKDKSGPDQWAVNSDAHLTLAIATDGKIAKTFGFVSVNDTLVPDVEAALKAALNK